MRKSYEKKNRRQSKPHMALTIFELRMFLKFVLKQPMSLLFSRYSLDLYDLLVGYYL